MGGRVLRVLHVLNELRHSGAETALVRIAPHAKADGVEAGILAVVEAEIGEYAPVLAAAGYRMHMLKFTRDMLFPARTWAFFRANRYDVVHVHCERAGFWLEAAAWASGVQRIVRTVHGLFRFDGGLRARRKAQRALARNLFGATTLAVSAGVAENEIARFGNPATVARLCVDTHAFGPPTADARRAARASFGIGADETCVAIVGACAAVKAHDVAFQAIARAAAAGVRLRVLHAGTGATEAEERAQVEGLGLGGQVSFLGVRDDVNAILAASDVYLMPSRVEALPLAAVEAMAMGLPCVLSDGPGIGELKAFGGAVEWVAVEAGAVADALVRLARVPTDDLRARGLAASEMVRVEFSPEVAWQRLRPHYRI